MTRKPSSGPGHGPPRGYSWAPITAEDNLARSTHGARSPTRVQPLADALAEQLAEAAPWTRAPAFETAVASWCWSEGQAALLRSYLDEVGLLDEQGVPRPAVGMLSRVESRLIRLRQELGLTPAALASLLKNAASVARATQDDRALAALAAEGQRILDARADAGGRRALAREGLEGAAGRVDGSLALGVGTPVPGPAGGRAGPYRPGSGGVH